MLFAKKRDFMQNLKKTLGKNQSGQGFYILGKDCVESLGLIRAGFISILADLDNYAKSQGQSRFFATLETLIEKSKLSDKTIKKLMRELKEWGIIDEGVRGEGYDNKKYYSFDYEKLAQIIYNNTLIDKGKNTPNDKGKNTPNDKGKNTLNNNIITNIQEQKNKNKDAPRKNAREIFLDFAKSEFEKAKPTHLTLNDFLEWIAYKIERTPKMTKTTITKNLNLLLKFGDKATESIQKSILNGWQGLFVPKENKSDLKHDSSQNNSQVNISYDENFKHLLNDYLCSKVGAIILGMRLVKFEILECGDVWLTLENNLRESMIRKIKAYEVKSVLDFWG